MSQTLQKMSPRKAKQKAKERDGWECRFCGEPNEKHKKKHDCGLHAHHIIKDNDGGKDHPSNLITVCRECHDLLEKTQAEALSRIKKSKNDEEKQVLREEIQKQQKQIQELEGDLIQERNKNNRVYAWLEDTHIKIHIVLVGTVNPSVKTFIDKEQAAKEYVENDSATTLLNTKCKISDLAKESLRYTSDNDVEFKFKPTGGLYFDDGEKPLQYYRDEVPEKYLENDRGGKS